MAPGWCQRRLKDSPTSPTPAETAIPPCRRGHCRPREWLGRSAARGLELPPCSEARGRRAGPGRGSARPRGRCAAPVVGGGCWGWGAAGRGWCEEALRADREIGGGGGGEAAGGSTGPAGPGDGGRGSLPVGKRLLLRSRTPRACPRPRVPAARRRRRRRAEIRACAAHFAWRAGHGAGHERGGALRT